MTAQDRGANDHRAGFRSDGRAAPTDSLSAGAAVGPLPDPLNLSHELRTPLTTILGNVELMLEGTTGPLSGAARAGLCDIEDAGRRLQRRIEEVLLLLDIRERSALPSREPVDLVELLCSTAARAAGPATVDFEIAPESAPLIVDGDRILLQHMSQIIVEIAAAQHCGRVGLVVEPADAPIGSLVLRLDWPGFDPGRVRPMEAALIEQVLRLHGAGGGCGADGVRFQWAGRLLERGQAGMERGTG
jgi:hypothetical protein